MSEKPAQKTESRPLSEEEIKALNFKPPVNYMSAPLPKSTKIIGYFNPNPWPVHVSVMGMSLTLMNRGDFILDLAGQKINDPRIEKTVCGAGMLTKEEGDDMLPVNSIVAPVQGDKMPYGFTGTEKVKKNADGLVVSTPPPAQLRPPPSPASGCSHTGMSIEEARQLGLINKPREMNLDQGIPDTEGLPPSGVEIPTLSSPPVSRGKNKHLPVAQPENAAQAKLVKSIESSADVDLTDENAVGTAIKMANKELKGDELPAPVLEDEAGDEIVVQDKKAAPPAAKPAKPKPKLPFVCEVDGKAFKYRSELERHAKKKFDVETVEKIMAPYPVK